MWIAVWCLSIRPALSERRDFCEINAFILFFLSLCYSVMIDVIYAFKMKD